MEIEVWSVGKTKFTADTEYQEPVIREAIDQRGDVASVILGHTHSKRSDISHDEYVRVTGDVPGLVRFEGWLTGNRTAPPPVPVERESAAFAAFASSEHERVAELTALVAEILADFWPGERFTGISEGLRDTQARVDGYRQRARLEPQQ